MDIIKLLPDISKVKFDNPQETQNLIQHLCNIIEKLAKENAEQKIEIQKLKDEINRLKGEKGKPKFKPPKKPKNSESKLEPPTKKEKPKANKKEQIKIDEKKVIKYEGELPADAVKKGYRSIIIQDIIIKTNNIEYKLESYYSPSEQKTYEAKIPENIKG